MKQSPVKTSLIIFFCMISVVRVALYSAAFPFFNNVDEEAHFDAVVKFSEGHVASVPEKFSLFSAKYIALYGSPEFFFKPEDFADKKIPAAFNKVKPLEKIRRVNESQQYWSRITNHECTQPPLYYFIAGMWLKFWHTLIGKDGNGLSILYLIRFLNIFLVAGLVWIAFSATHHLWPENKLMLIGVPLLVAIMPQDIYYSIQSDVLSPFFYGLTFLYLIKFLNGTGLTVRNGLNVGITLGCTLLIKATNIVLLPLVIVFIVIKMNSVLKQGALKKFVFSFVAFFSATTLFVFFLLTWNIYFYGDVTGSHAKMELLGWNYKPVTDWLDNSLFTISGGWEFLSEIIASLWRGEFAWSRERLSSHSIDVFYVISSLIFVGIAIVFTFKQSINKISFSFTTWSFLSCLFFIILLSLSIDFSGSTYPSADKPYFTSGRLISASLIPFLILYVYGFDILFKKVKNQTLKIGVLVLIAVGITVSEIIINWPVFSSDYNLFAGFN